MTDEKINPLAGKALRYLIGSNGPWVCKDDEIIEVPYGAILDAKKSGNWIQYINLFDELNSGKYAPYLHDSDTADEYDEGEIDPNGVGWTRNLVDQFTRAHEQGFKYAELDNPDAYPIKPVLGAVTMAQTYDLKIIAKNPGLNWHGDERLPYVQHPNVYGIIVERGAGTPDSMDRMRKLAQKPTLPVWFVGFGSRGKLWANSMATQAKNYRNIGVTWSSQGEYGNAIDIFKPVKA